jgi:hypothetical protein
MISRTTTTSTIIKSFISNKLEKVRNKTQPKSIEIGDLKYKKIKKSMIVIMTMILIIMMMKQIII